MLLLIFCVHSKKKKFTDIRVARAPHPHQSLPDPLTPPLLSLSPNPSPYQPFREGVLGRDASDITFLTRSPTLIGWGACSTLGLLTYQSVDVSGWAVCTTSACQSGLRGGCVVSF
eukprot:scaffold4839_cov136-Isochrysis_galbana.AAC.2